MINNFVTISLNFKGTCLQPKYKCKFYNIAKQVSPQYFLYNNNYNAKLNFAKLENIKHQSFNCN